jgi:dTDP-4-dehydrorhamnose 3,5-epimerase
MSFYFEKTGVITGAMLCRSSLFTDERGIFAETYKKPDFVKAGLNVDFVQDNFSFSHRYVLRGLHLQSPPFAQAKLIRCVSGEIFDVAVDLRPESISFGKWEGHVLSAENQQAFFIPAGCAHGFLTISESSVVYYKASNVYAPDHEFGLRWNDTQIAIRWPLPSGFTPVLSEKDAHLTLFSDLLKS